MGKSLLITFEGIDGCGKSTQSKLVHEWLTEISVPSILTREPGGCPVAESIRGLLLSPSFPEMVPRCELLLYLAARSQHILEVIEPALKKGMIVLCDRFHDATLAYQGYGRGLSHSSIVACNDFAMGGILPDKTFLFDIPVETAFSRMKAMEKGADRLESSSKDFFERTRNGYLSIARDNAKRIHVLNSQREKREVFNEVKSVIEKLL